MRINFFSFQENSATATGYKNILSYHHDICFQSWNFKEFDVNIFTGFSEEISFLNDPKNQFGNDTLIGIVDPKSKQLLNKLSRFDFIVVDSLEMELHFRELGKPIIRMAEFPNLASSKTKSTVLPASKIKVGYHGNRQHIMAMFPHISEALRALGEEFDVELLLIYNQQKLGKVPNIFPENIIVNHVQWAPSSYEQLAECSFGLVPNLMPISARAHNKISKSKFFLERDDDYITRYKMLSNPGRAIIFMNLGIPVITDLNPSSLELIDHAKDGYIASDTASYYFAMKQLSCPKINSRIRENIPSKISKYAPELQINNFVSDLENLKKELISPIVIPAFSRFSYQRFNFEFVYFLDFLRKCANKLRK